MIKQLAYLIIILFFSTVSSANDFIGKSAFAPDITLNLKITDQYTFNFKAESFHNIFDRTLTPDEWQQYYDGTDFQIFLTRSIGPLQRIAVGYQWGLDPEGADSHRLMQQFTWRGRAASFTAGHRIRLDQTFSEESAVRLRLRYRYSAEIPLQGQILDPGEFFILTSGEAILSSQDRDEDLETRLVLQAGYLIKPGQRVQLGTDFRSRASNDFANNNLLVKLGLSLTL
jgi:hypothetical protein